MAFGRTRSFTIAHGQCGSTDSTGFKVWFKLTAAELKTTGNGGYVTSAVGDDIAWFSDSGLTTALKFERIYYNASTGDYWGWVKVPTLSHTSDVVLYLGYGDSGISTYQGDNAGTWSGYLRVYHLTSDGSTMSLVDSTGIGTTATQPSGTVSPDASGLTRGSGFFNYYANSYLDIGNGSDLLTLAGDFTIEAQVRGLTPYTFTAGGMVWTGNHRMRLQVASGPINVQMSTDAGMLVRGSTTMSDDNVPYNIAGSLDGAGTGQFAYLNGVLEASNSGANGMTTGSGNADIGNDRNSGSSIVFMSEVKIASPRLSVDWLLASWNNVNSPGTFYTLGADGAFGGGGGGFNAGRAGATHMIGGVH